MALLHLRSVLRLGLVGALLLSGCSLLPSVLEPKFGADALVSADTWSFTDVTLRPSVPQALQMRDVMDIFSGPAENAGADLHHLPTPSGRIIDFEKDVLPRLDGELVLAVGGAPDDPSYTVLTHTNDLDATLRLLVESESVLTRDARGVIRYDPSPGEYFIAGYKNWIVATNSRDLREQTLDRIDGKGSPSLASDKRYQSVVDRITGDRLGFGYFNVSPLLERALSQDTRLADVLPASGRVAYSFGFEQGPQAGVYVLGMRIEYSADSPIATRVPANLDALAAMDRLPQASMFAIAGPEVGLNPGSLEALSSGEEVPSEVQAVFAQFTGPFAIGFTKPPGSLLDVDSRSVDRVVNTLIGGVFVIAKVSPDIDVDQVSGAVDSVFDMLGESADFAGGWEHEVVIDDDWLAINAVPPTYSLADVPEDLLASERLYQWVRSGFGRNGSNVFINLQAFEAALGNDVTISDALAAVAPFRAIGISGQSEATGDGHAHLTVLIQAP